MWVLSYAVDAGCLVSATGAYRDAPAMSAQFPISLPYSGWKRHLILGTGRALVSVFPEKASRLKAGEVPSEPSRWDRLLLAGLVDTHLRRGRLDELTALHDWVWTGDVAVNFHAGAEARFAEVFLAHHSAIVPALQAAMTDTGGRYTTVCEIGCGSGLVLDHLSRTLAGQRQYIGLDMSPRQVELNRRRFEDRPLRFEAGEGLTWVLRNGQRRSIFFTNGGVLEYFPPRRLHALLSWIAGALSPSLVAIVEPLADGHDADADPDSRPFGIENTFSHPYPRAFAQAGLEVLWRREVWVGAQRWLMMVAYAPGNGATLRSLR
jgi:SAM-dependent methyltransferase